MRVVVLGGTGFIGQPAVAALWRAGHEVIVAGRGADVDLPLDVTTPGALDTLRETASDVVLNLLGSGLSAGTAAPATMQRINAELPAEIARALAGTSAHLIHAASSTERQPGQDVDESEYSRTKHEGSRALRELAAAEGLNTTLLTIHNTYGPQQPSARFIAAVIASLRANEPVPLHYPHRVRDFVYLDDVVACILHAVTQTPSGLADVQVGTGIGLSLQDAALAVADALGRPGSLVESGTPVTDDPSPVTVCPIPGGTYGLCTTAFRDGIRRTVEAS